MEEFKHPKEELDRFRKRLGFASGFVLFCFCVLIIRLVWLQIVQYKYYKTRAEENRIALVPITPSRGLILDRNGVVLARNYSAYTLEITPSKINGKLDDVINQLSKLVDIEPHDRKRFKKLLEESKNFESLPIRTQLTDDEVARFIANRYRFPGVDIKARLFRQYPQGELASHLLGYISRINDADLARIDAAGQTQNYRGTEFFGKSGLEQHYEFQLHGTSGVEQIEVDAGGHAVRTLSRTAPIAGDNLTLTIDAKLQKIAEDAFGKQRGALVAIDPTTGGILAFVSMPNYDPNLFVDGIDSQDWKALNESPDKPMLDRAINGTYPPGSTFKPYMALAALETGKRTPEQSIVDPGYFNFGGHRFRDDTKGGHGIVDMYKSIVVSCDTYYYMLANDLGIDAIAKFMAQFGFGSKTGVDIDGESKGVLPSPQWKMQHFKNPAQQKWYPGETISIGIGQGYNSYTPIQLAQALATLANNGVMYRPHLVNYVTDTRTGQKEMIDPQPERTIPLKQANIDVVKHAMVGVNSDPEGTGARAFANAGYTSGGKTGTAQVFSLKGAQYKSHAINARLRDHALFIAFAPADHPKIVVAVVVENGGWGAEAAAPIARQVFDYYLLGKVPNAPAAPDTGAKDNDTPDAATAPEDVPQ